MAAEFLGFTGRLYPTKDGRVAHYLRKHGYGTYWLGKSHLTPDEASTDLGYRTLRHGGRLFNDGYPLKVILLMTGIGKRTLAATIH